TASVDLNAVQSLVGDVVAGYRSQELVPKGRRGNLGVADPVQSAIVCDPETNEMLFRGHRIGRGCHAALVVHDQLALSGALNHQTAIQPIQIGGAVAKIHRDVLSASDEYRDQGIGSLYHHLVVAFAGIDVDRLDHAGDVRVLIPVDLDDNPAAGVDVHSDIVIESAGLAVASVA